MTVTVSVPDKITQEAQAEGLSVEAYVERLLKQAAETEFSYDMQERQKTAVDRLLAFGAKHQLTLGAGVRIKDLIHEGHKY